MDNYFKDGLDTAVSIYFNTITSSSSIIVIGWDPSMNMGHKYC